LLLFAVLAAGTYFKAAAVASALAFATTYSLATF
jgi:hypothetical protein